MAPTSTVRKYFLLRLETYASSEPCCSSKQHASLLNVVVSSGNVASDCNLCTFKSSGWSPPLIANPATRKTPHLFEIRLCSLSPVVLYHEISLVCEL